MGIAYLGISSAETRAALELCDVPRRRWPRVSVGVHHMGRVAASVMNQKKA
jgi:hypothetical protein